MTDRQISSLTVSTQDHADRHSPSKVSREDLATKTISFDTLRARSASLSCVPVARHLEPPCLSQHYPGRLVIDLRRWCGAPTAFSTWCLPSITQGVFEPSTLAAEGPSLPNATQVSRARRVSCKTGLGAKSVRTKSTVLMNFGCTLATKERTVWTRLRWGLVRELGSPPSPDWGHDGHRSAFECLGSWCNVFRDERFLCRRAGTTCHHAFRDVGEGMWQCSSEHDFILLP